MRSAFIFPLLIGLCVYGDRPAFGQEIGSAALLQVMKANDMQFDNVILACSCTLLSPNISSPLESSSEWSHSLSVSSGIDRTTLPPEDVLIGLVLTIGTAELTGRVADIPREHQWISPLIRSGDITVSIQSPARPVSALVSYKSTLALRWPNFVVEKHTGNDSRSSKWASIDGVLETLESTSSPGDLGGG